MTVESQNRTNISFSDVIGKFSVLHDTVFLPKITAFSKLASLPEAEEKLTILSNVAFSGKTVLTHGTIFNREYIFFYSTGGRFAYTRILNDKLDNLTFFAQDGFRLIVFLARELDSMIKAKANIQNFFNKVDVKKRKPKIAVIFESEIIKDKLGITAYDIFDVLDEVEVIFFLGDELQKIEKKDRALLLC